METYDDDQDPDVAPGDEEIEGLADEDLALEDLDDEEPEDDDEAY
jgi:hypothetical protein